MKRTIGMLMAAVMIATTGLLAGCGKGGAKAKGEKEIVIWWAQWAPADGLQELAKAYEAETGITVRVHQIPWGDFENQVFLNFGNESTDFDVVIGDSQWLGRGATKGLYVDLTKWLPKAVALKNIHKKVLANICAYPAGSKSYWAAPCESDAIGLAYRKDWFADKDEQKAYKKFSKGKALKVPDTWADYQKVAKFFTRPDAKKYGHAIITGREYDALTMGYQQVMWAYGGSWGKGYKARGAVNSKESVAALTFFKGLMDFSPPGGSNLGYAQVLEQFSNDSTAMILTYFAFYPGIAKSMEGKVGFAPVPKGPKGRAASLGGQGFSVSAKIPEARQEMAKEFIKWFLKKDIQEQWITKDAGFTADTRILENKVAVKKFKAAQPYNAAFITSLASARDFWNVPVYNEMLSASQRLLGEALDGGKKPKEALDALAAEHDKILSDAGLQKAPAPAKKKTARKKR